MSQGTIDPRLLDLDEHVPVSNTEPSSMTTNTDYSQDSLRSFHNEQTDISVIQYGLSIPISTLNNSNNVEELDYSALFSDRYPEAILPLISTNLRIELIKHNTRVSSLKSMAFQVLHLRYRLALRVHSLKILISLAGPRRETIQSWAQHHSRLANCRVSRSSSFRKCNTPNFHKTLISACLILI